MKREDILRKIKLFLETCSDKQLALLDNKIKEMIVTESFKRLEEKEPFVGWGKDTSTYESIILKTSKKLTN